MDASVMYDKRVTRNQAKQHLENEMTSNVEALPLQSSPPPHLTDERRGNKRRQPSPVSFSNEQAPPRKGRPPSSDTNKYGPVVAKRPYKRKVAFSWTRYAPSEEFAPESIFTNCVSRLRASAKLDPGMKLEAVDPLHPWLVCLVTVMEVKPNNRLRIHFEGSSPRFDTLVHADSPFLFPLGWSESIGRRITPPGCVVPQAGFNIFQYVHEFTSGEPRIADASNFSHLPGNPIDGVDIGANLEAINRDTQSFCKAYVRDIIENWLLVGFHGEPDFSCYWAHYTSRCLRHSSQPDSESIPPSVLLGSSSPIDLKIGSRIEVVDKFNNALIRVARVVEVRMVRDGPARVRIRMDGWSEDRLSFWLDADSPDIWPPGSCSNLTPPPDLSVVSSNVSGSCPTPGCRGMGHVKGPRYGTHHNSAGCPYADARSPLPDRLTELAVSEKTSPVNTLLPLSGTGSGDDSSSTGHDSGCCATNGSGSSEAALRLSVHESVFLPPHPSIELPMCLENQCRLLPSVEPPLESVSRWSPQQVAQFVKSLPGCERQSQVFVEEQIDGEAFLLLSQVDIARVLNVKLGPALKVFSSILLLKNMEQAMQH